MVREYIVLGTVMLGAVMKDTSILGVKIWRQKKGITLETIAASTKLSMRQLEAIESGNFGRLPGGIYNTNYIKQYARAIEFDELDLLAFYEERCRPATASIGGSQRPPSRFARLLLQH
jgi:transcriptional regulator with XRE-family HTH domain